MTRLMEDEVATLAMKTAAAVAKGWGYLDWREYVYGAYVKIRHAVDSGITDGALLILAGRRGIIDALRQEKPNGVDYRQQLVGIYGHVQFGYGNVPDADTMIAPSYQKDVADRLLTIWGETKEHRQHLKLRCRMVAYLKLIEDWTLKEIGDVLGLTESRISQMMTGFIKGVSCPKSLQKGGDS